LLTINRSCVALTDLRLSARKLSESLIYERLKEINKEELRKRTLVFAPHPDDETLGCGGTILKKRLLGVPVNICFMTNGEASHSGIISKEALRDIRVEEGKTAARMLGIDTVNLEFLDLPDSGLSSCVDAGVQKVGELITSFKPEEIFVPSKYEPTIIDHSISNKIVLIASKLYQKEIIVNEYPIWLWNHFPHVRIPSIKHVLSYLGRSFISESMLLTKFTSFVNICDVMDTKRDIINAYKSQICRSFINPPLRTLYDLGEGDFLNRFLQEYEIFRRYNLNQ
jgi:LmbE family N-acetylglucosaminyl deacetylase